MNESLLSRTFTLPPHRQRVKAVNIALRIADDTPNGALIVDTCSRRQVDAVASRKDPSYLRLLR
jgi:hypothetical protein